MSVKPGHGDHWLAALPQEDPRLSDALGVPADAPEALQLRRAPLTDAIDMVQVTARRRLVTAYPEPRATALLEIRPRELAVWDTRVEGWMVGDHEDAGTLTLFATDLAEAAHRYAAAGRRGPMGLEVAGLAYLLGRTRDTATPRLAPASREDARFLPDDYAFTGRVLRVERTQAEEVLDLEFHNGLSFPVTHRSHSLLQEGDLAEGFLWLTCRLPARADAATLGT